MKAVDVLKHEHALVRRLLDCLRALRREARARGTVDREATTALLALFERFVDWSHQDKEELHLFPHLLARATPEDSIRLACVFAEHTQERRRLVGMYLHMDAACRGEAASVERFLANARAYERLQRAHVEAEEEFVLPLGDAILTDEDDGRIRQGFHEIDGRLGKLGRLDGEVAAVCRRFEVEPVEETAR